MIGKSIFLNMLIGVTATVAVAGIGFGYFGVGKPRGGEQAAAPQEIKVPAPAPRKPSNIAISGRFKKDLTKPPEFALGDRLIPFAADEEDQKSFLAGGTIEIVTVDGKVVATGGIADNGTFALEIPPAPQYIVRAQNEMVSVSYAVVTGGLPEMKIIANAADAAHGAGAAHGEKGKTAKH